MERSSILEIIFQLNTNALALIVAKILRVANDIVHCAERATNGSSLPRIVHKEFALADCSRKREKALEKNLTQ